MQSVVLVDFIVVIIVVYGESRIYAVYIIGLFVGVKRAILIVVRFDKFRRRLLQAI